MGRIKSTMIKKAAIKLIEKSPDAFSPDFEKNKFALADTMPSKPIRNKVAGYLARLKRPKREIKKKEIFTEEATSS